MANFLNQDWLIFLLSWFPCVAGFAVSAARYSRQIQSGKLGLFDAFLAGCGCLLLLLPFLIFFISEIQQPSNLVTLSIFSKLGVVLFLSTCYFWVYGYLRIMRNRNKGEADRMPEQDVI